MTIKYIIRGIALWIIVLFFAFYPVKYFFETWLEKDFMWWQESIVVIPLALFTFLWYDKKYYNK